MSQNWPGSGGNAAYLLVLALSLLAIAPTWADGASAFVAGELLVKFTDASQSGALVARAMRAEQMPGEGAVVSTSLSAELGVPLTATRVTSGRELLLRVDVVQLRQVLTQHLKRDRSVRSVVPAEVPRTALPAAQIAFVCELEPDSEARKLVREAAQAGLNSTPEIRAFIARAAAGADLQLRQP